MDTNDLQFSINHALKNKTKSSEFNNASYTLHKSFAFSAIWHPNVTSSTKGEGWKGGALRPGAKRKSAFLLHLVVPQTFNGSPPDEVEAIVSILWKRKPLFREDCQDDSDIVPTPKEPLIQ